MREGLALITGSSKGIGLGIATAALRDGYDVLLTARTESELRAQRDSLREQFPQARIQYVPGSIAERKTHDFIEQEVERADAYRFVQVNNAGIFHFVPALNAHPLDRWTSPSREDRERYSQQVAAMIDVAKGHSMLTQRMSKYLLEHNGAVLDVLSAALITKYTNNFGYAASKAAQWENSLDVAANSRGAIKTARIFPSNTDTDMVLDSAVPKLDETLVAHAAWRMVRSNDYSDLYLEQISIGESPFRAGFFINPQRFVVDGAFDGASFATRYHHLVNSHIRGPLAQERRNQRLREEMPNDRPAALGN